MKFQPDRLATEISATGVTDIFGIPGSGRSLELIDALEKHRVAFHKVHFEGSAAMMAGANAVVSGGVGVSVSIKGPGLVNMLPGLALCSLENYPIVALCESHTKSDLEKSVHKVIDHGQLVSPLAKCVIGLKRNSCGFPDAKDLAKEEKPGVVVLNLSSELDSRTGDRISRKTHTGPSEDVGNVLKALERCRKPIVIVGSYGHRQEWVSQLEHLSVPLFTTAAAKGTIDESKAYSAGVFTGAGLEKSLEYGLLGECDLVVGFGLEKQELLSFDCFTCPLINVVNSNTFGTLGISKEAVISEDWISHTYAILKEKIWGRDELEAKRGVLSRYLFRDEFLPAEVFRLIQDKLGRKARLVCDTGLFCVIAEHSWTGANSNYLGASNSRYMGVGLPMAIGASLADRNNVTVVALGDGGIGMFLAELHLVKALTLPLLILFFTDGGYGSIITKAVEKNLAQTALVDDKKAWADIVAGFGVDTVTVNNLSALSSALNEWTSSSPLFIECRFNVDKYRNMTRSLRG